MRRTLWLSAFIYLTAFAPSALFASDYMTAKIKEILTEASAQCMNGELMSSDTLVESYDLDADQKVDLTIVNQINFKCRTESGSLFQGSAGALIHLITETDYMVGPAQSVRVINEAPSYPALILLGLHGSSCGEPGYVSCIQAVTFHNRRLVKVK